MSKPGKHRQIGNLTCYLIQDAFLKAAPEKKTDVVVTGKEIHSNMVEIFNDDAKLDEIKSDMKYNYVEVAQIESIVKYGGANFLKRTINKYLKDYAGGGLIPFSEDGGIAFYKLSPIALKVLESGGTLNNRNMSGR